MRYKEIRRTAIVDPYDFDKNYFIQNCRQAIEQYYKGNTIFRGIRQRNEQILFGDPRQHTRKSANTTNYYTLLIDHILPNWKSYPPRSKSWICSSNRSSASGYGGGVNGTYAVFPFNDTKIAIASSDDFWWSFNYMYDFFPFNMSDFNHEFRRMGEEILGKFNETVRDIKRLIKYFNDNDIRQDDVCQRSELAKVVVERYGGNLEKALIDLLSPQKNGFKLTTISDYENDVDDREIWFSGPAYFIKPEIVEEIIPQEGF